MPRLVPQTLLHSGAIVAVVLAVVVYIFLWRTTIGYRIRAVGLNPDASRYAGINVPSFQALSLTLAGGFAGLAGVVEVIGVQHRLLEGITSGYGFTGIVAALFGGLHPLGLIPASVLFGGLLVGADKMQRAVQVPSSLMDMLLGLVVLFVWVGALVAAMGGPAQDRRSDRGGDAAVKSMFSLAVIVGHPQHHDRAGDALPVRGDRRDDRADLRRGEPGRGRHHAGRRVRRLLRGADDRQPVAGPARRGGRGPCSWAC